MLKRMAFGGMIMLLLSVPGSTWASPDPWKVSGPEECAECHDVEYENWEETHHSLTFESMPDSDEGVAIGEKLGFDDVVEAELCQSCHLTLQSEGVDEAAEVIAGVSCESCHGASIDWIEVHSEEDKTPEQEQTLWAEAEAAGMIRPGNVYAFARNCLSCHVVPRERLVNDGGHTAGSEFNLVTWSQGEVRHNTFHTPDNNEASSERKRLMAVLGAAAELEVGLKALAAVEDTGGEYASALVDRLQAARAALAKMAELTGVADVQAISDAVADLSLTLPVNKAQTEAAAAAVSSIALRLSNGSEDLSALDAMIESFGDYRGEPQT